MMKVFFVNFIIEVLLSCKIFLFLKNIMHSMNNKQIILKNRPVGFPDTTTWELETQTIPTLVD